MRNDVPRRADARRNRARILKAAEAVFAEQGASASTQAVAARAGVAIGTVFRHFPAKPDLLNAVVMHAWEQLLAEVDGLLDDPDDEGAVLHFCAAFIEIASRNRAAFVRLAETGSRVHIGDALVLIRPRIEALLDRARKAHLVRRDLQPEELIGLLAALGQEAMTSDWSANLRQRALTILFEGLANNVES